MDIKTIHDNQIKDIMAKARALDKDAKIELIKYLEKTCMFMDMELKEFNVEWSNLKYLENKQARNFFENDLNDYTIGWKCDEQEIIDFDKQVIAELKKGL